MIALVATCKNQAQATAAEKVLRTMGIACGSVMMDEATSPSVITRHTSTEAWTSAICTCNGTYRIPIPNSRGMMRLSVESIDKVPPGSIMRMDGSYVPPPFSGNTIMLHDNKGESAKMRVTQLSFDKGDLDHFWEVKLERVN